MIPENPFGISPPRLLYIGDVPVESSYHGSALLFRLFEEYPPDRLVIIESEDTPSEKHRRLKNVRYFENAFPFRRLRRTRFHALYLLIRALFASRTNRKIKKILKDFRPDAVVTVAHGYSWMTASALADRHSIPLHLIVHDHLPSTCTGFRLTKALLQRRFTKSYRIAKSRLCVSPFMEEEYRNRYSVGGTILFPARSRRTVVHNSLPEASSAKTGALVGAFAGSINSVGYAKLLKLLAQALETDSGKLFIYGPQSLETIRELNLNASNIYPKGLIPSGELVETLRRETDFLFVPMSFDHDGHEENMRLSFPSKLTEYTASGLPILICGPSSCSAVRWADQTPAVAEVATAESNADLVAAIEKLKCPAHRAQLVLASTAAGEQDFSHARMLRIFSDAINSDSD
jgi:hypothetical protein